MAPLLEIKGLKTHFSTDDGMLQAVDGVDITLNKGETLCVVGESGCGKTVTAMSILKLIAMPPGRIVEGQILFEGRDLVPLTSHELDDIRAKDIGFIFQEPMTSLNPVLTVGEQVAEVLRRHEGLSNKDALARTVEMFKLRWREFRVEDFFIAVRGGRLIGVLGCWDQTSFKQTRIAGYTAPLRWLVPAANVLHPLIGTPRFPQPGEEVPYFYIGFLAVDGDDLRVFRALLRFLYNQTVGSRHAYAILALHERDPLLPALREYSLTSFSGRLFCVTFDDGEASFRNLDGRVPYMEAATF